MIVCEAIWQTLGGTGAIRAFILHKEKTVQFTIEPLAEIQQFYQSMEDMTLALLYPISEKSP